MEIRRILIGVDFSEVSRAALDYGVALAQRLGADVELVHVYQLPAFAVTESIAPAPPDTLSLVEDESRRQLEEWAERARAHGVRATCESVPGSPSAELCDRAVAGRFDLIVVGSNGRGALASALLGSVAEKVVRRSPVPVLTVRGGTAAT